MIRYGLHRLRADLVRAMHARERRSRETRETWASASPVSRHQSRVLLDGLEKKERLLVVYGLQKPVSKHLKMSTCCSALIPQQAKSFSEWEVFQWAKDILLREIASF